MMTLELLAWRHPRAEGAGGRCIGRTDLPVDPRRAKRLAHHIRRLVRRQRLPRRVWVSPLRRSCAVGRWLRRWGFQCPVDARLAEMHFGNWDGQPWSAIAWEAVDAWRADLLQHAPGGGESLAALHFRACDFVRERAHAGDTQLLLVGHGGWINALRTLGLQTPVQQLGTWPPAPPHGSLSRWRADLLR